MFRGCENRDGELPVYCRVCAVLFSRAGPDDEDCEILAEIIGTMISKLLFKVSGIISGHSPNHFWSFFSSTGKKVIKISTENVFVIITFSVNIVEQMVAPYWVSDWENPSHEVSTYSSTKHPFDSLTVEICLKIVPFVLQITGHRHKF